MASVFVRLLRIYSKYKIELLCPDVDEEDVWTKIADELQEQCPLICDGVQCREKIQQLKQDYNIFKKRKVISQEMADFLNEAKNAFETVQNPVQVKNVDELLKTNICTILNSVSDEKVKSIINVVKKAGLKSLSDLQFVHEDDLLYVLKPIQRRKLIKAWKESGTSVAKSNNVSSQKSKWNWQKRLTLLRIYSFVSSSNTCKKKVWRKVATKAKKLCSLSSCTVAECRIEINSMYCEYKTSKHRMLNASCYLEAIFLDEAKLAFEVTENPKQPRSFYPFKWVWKKASCLKLLETYKKFKSELAAQNVKEHTIWEKISLEVSENSSLYYGEYSCRYKISCLQKRYENFKQDMKGVKMPYFFDEAQKAFETTE